MSDVNKMKRVKKYYKVTILRNPLERLVSAYRDKLESPLVYGKRGWEAQTQLEILRKSRTAELENWQSSNGSFTIQISFPEYVQWVVDTRNSALNEHFAPQIEDIYPCRMKYDFFGNFKQLGKDMAIVIKKLDAPVEYFPNVSYHDPRHQTKNLMKDYYSQLDKKLKQELFLDLYQELDFYYHLYPEERTSHCELLETSELIQWSVLMLLILMAELQYCVTEHIFSSEKLMLHIGSYLPGNIIYRN